MQEIMLKKDIENFCKYLSIEDIDIYNEASIQYELAIYLKNNVKERKIQLERNIDFFKKIDYSEDFLKKELDIVIFDENQNFCQCIELKFPRKGQHPEQMFSACKDVKFLEQLVKSGFKQSFFVMFADDPLFYDNKKGRSKKNIYEIFRSENPAIQGCIKKPTGEDKGEIKFDIKGNYPINWISTDKQLESNNGKHEELKYFIIEIPGKK